MCLYMPLLAPFMLIQGKKILGFFFFFFCVEVLPDAVQKWGGVELKVPSWIQAEQEGNQGREEALWSRMS